ncbi:hypothetical protein [Phyllobacterium sp. SB3]|uniref:hypothetical protein n=1 Tax=Phyllobacterium sp. SB3 TaxID=3156073 RepID=UPI0032AEAC4E
MHIIIETRYNPGLPKPLYRSRNVLKQTLQNKTDERQSSGFTREELRRIVAEQID